MEESVWRRHIEILFGGQLSIRKNGTFRGDGIRFQGVQAIEQTVTRRSKKLKYFVKML
jgi:hypothetical protein